MKAKNRMMLIGQRSVLQDSLGQQRRVSHADQLTFELEKTRTAIKVSSHDSVDQKQQDSSCQRKQIKLGAKKEISVPTTGHQHKDSVDQSLTEELSLLKQPKNENKLSKKSK